MITAVLKEIRSLTKSSSGLEAPPTKNYELFMVSECPKGT